MNPFAGLLLWIGGILIGIGIGSSLEETNNYLKCKELYQEPAEIVECLEILEQTKW
jgi:hypothetical protein